MTRLGSTKFKSVHSRTLNQPTPPLERSRVVVRGATVKSTLLSDRLTVNWHWRLIGL